MITEKLFNSLFPVKGLDPRKFNLVRRRKELINALNLFLPKYEINTHKRVCAFLANCGIETDYFKTTSEYASGWAYDISVNPAKAKNLGNLRKGDGPRYKGSGLSQTTGGYNFGELQKAIGKRLGIDVVKNPEILRENIEVAVESACVFWSDHNLNRYADKGEFQQLSGIVNRGDKNKMPLHWAKRNELYSKLLRVIPQNFKFIEAPATSPGAPEVSIATDNSSPESLAVPQVTMQPTEETDQATADAEQSKIKEKVDKYLTHFQSDSAKNIFQVIAARIGAAISALLALGITGKIFLIIISLAIIGIFLYAFFKYRARFRAWIKAIFDSVFS